MANSGRTEIDSPTEIQDSNGITITHARDLHGQALSWGWQHLILRCNVKLSVVSKKSLDATLSTLADSRR